MGILDFFFGRKPQQTAPVEASDERKAECPYCQEPLSQVPGRKTKCPQCGNFMYVRTRPKDNVRIVVTKEQANKIDEEWSIVTRTHESFVAEKEGFEKERETLRKKFGGKEPTDNDVQWGLLNKQLLEHAQNGDWGLYRNCRFEMGEILRRETKLKDALSTYLEVCYLDLNGPNNTGGVNDPVLFKQFPPFNPTGSNAFLAPGIIERIQQILKKLEIERSQLQEQFVEHNSRVHQALRLPLSPMDCSNKVENEVWK